MTKMILLKKRKGLYNNTEVKMKIKELHPLKKTILIVVEDYLWEHL